VHLETHLALIEKTLNSLLKEQPEALHSALFEAARYSLLSSGKRLRPLLLLAAAESFQAPVEHSIVPACAFEMIHTYSLIHDDLPSMDNDDLRRGKPTLHKVYAEGHALLTGDFLLTFAFQVLAESPHLDAEQKLALILTLSRAAGSEGMIGGQSVDLSSAGKEIDWPTLHFMHLGKTAALIAAAMKCGGIIGKAPPTDLDILHNAGMLLGLAFQVTDDILDVSGSEVLLGKQIGSDSARDKPTAVSLLGLAKAETLAEELLLQAKKLLDTLSKPAPALAALADKLVFRSS
jgi:geranylgeranyl diphosphate synthase type II